MADEIVYQTLLKLEKKNESLEKKIRNIYISVGVLILAIVATVVVVGVKVIDEAKNIASLKSAELFEKVKLEAATYPSIRSKSIEIVDSRNKLRAKLGVTKEGDVWQDFLDQKGVKRLSTGITSDGIARVRMYDENNNVRWSSSASRSDASQVVFGTSIYSSAGKPVFGFNLDQNAATSLFMSDPNGELRIWMLNQNDGLSGLYFKDRNGRFRIGNGVTKEGISFIDTWGVDGKSKMHVVTGQDGSFENYVYQTTGQQAWKTTSDFMTGYGALQLLMGLSNKENR